MQYQINTNLKVTLQTEHNELINKNSSCVVPISVGQYYHEGEKFIVTLKEIEKNFENATILICDSLQRHNIKIGKNCSDEKALKIANNNGLEWRKRYEKIINNLTINTRIMHWDEFINSPNYNYYYSKINLYYNSDCEFKTVVKQTIGKYLTRKYKKLQITENYRSEEKYCLDYLKEECAVRLMYKDFRFNYHVYPTEDNLAMKKVHKKFIPVLENQIVIPITLRFRHKKTIQFYNFFLNKI